MTKILDDGLVTMKGLVAYDKVTKVEKIDRVFVVHYKNANEKIVTTDIIVKENEVDATEARLRALICFSNEELRKKSMLESSGVWLWVFLGFMGFCGVLNAFDIASRLVIILVVSLSSIVCLVGSYKQYLKENQVLVLKK